MRIYRVKLHTAEYLNVVAFVQAWDAEGLRRTLNASVGFALPGVKELQTQWSAERVRIAKRVPRYARLANSTPDARVLHTSNAGE